MSNLLKEISAHFLEVGRYLTIFRLQYSSVEKFELAVSDSGRQTVVYNHYPRFIALLSNKTLNLKTEWQFIDDFRTAIHTNIGIFEPIVDDMKDWLEKQNLEL